MTKRATTHEQPTADHAIGPVLETQAGAKAELGNDHPLNDIAGAYEGPTWERILRNIRQNRVRANREASADPE